MSQVSKRHLSPKIEKRIYEIFIEAIQKVKNTSTAINFLDDIFSPTEKTMLAKRVTIALLLLRGDYTYKQIIDNLKVSHGTVAKMSLILKTKGKGFREILLKALESQALKAALSELFEEPDVLPPKGANWSEWRKRKYLKKTQKKF